MDWLQSILKSAFLHLFLMKRLLFTGGESNREKPYILSKPGCDKNEKLLAHGTSKLMVAHNKQSINDVVDYIGSSKFQHTFLRN
jgi:hypothetical protein